MDIMTLAQSKKFTKEVALGIGSMRVSGTTVYFTLADSGEEVSVTLPTPADGKDGAAGNGISSVALISTVGLVKTYRMTFTDGTTFDFSTTDGKDKGEDVIPVGATVTPINDMQTLFECAGLKDTYSAYSIVPTISDICNNYTLLTTFLVTNNAADYFIRCTDFATTVQSSSNFSNWASGNIDSYFCDLAFANTDIWTEFADGGIYYQMLKNKEVLNTMQSLMVGKTTETWTQPSLKANGTVGGDDYACDASTYFASYYPYYAFDKSLSTSWNVSASASTFPYTLTFYSPNPINVSEIDLTYYVDGSTYAAKTTTVQLSIDGESWLDAGTISGTTSTSSGTTNSLNINYDNYAKYIRIGVTEKFDGRNYVGFYELGIIGTQWVEA